MTTTPPASASCSLGAPSARPPRKPAPGSGSALTGAPEPRVRLAARTTGHSHSTVPPIPRHLPGRPAPRTGPSKPHASSHLSRIEARGESARGPIARASAGSAQRAAAASAPSVILATRRGPPGLAGRAPTASTRAALTQHPPYTPLLSPARSRRSRPGQPEADVGKTQSAVREWPTPPPPLHLAPVRPAPPPAQPVREKVGGAGGRG